MVSLRRLLVLVVATLLVPTVSAHEFVTEPANDACGGVAPEQVQCSTGVHRSLTTVFNGIIFQVSGPFVGTIEYRLDGATFTYVARWTHWPDGTQHVTESWSGVFLPLLPYTHECAVFAPGTSDPGGEGHWQCFHAHDML